MLQPALYLDDRNQAFYTEADEITSLMTELLGPVEDKFVLEPSVGQGAFIGSLKGIPKQVDAVDVDEAALRYTVSQYPNVHPIHADFIQLCLNGGLFNDSGIKSQYYDAVISNPPYGLRFSHAFRKGLKRRLGRFYVRESYGLFLRLSIDRLVAGGRYVFIIPDTFLTSHNHRPLREFLMT
ncbi:MAG: Eco57I restriction-modification methylase domain-containing protein [Alphaproteobacteria bacterium]